MGASPQPSTSKEDGGNGVNILREIPLRYFGYANEVGESFRYQFPRLVAPTYLVAFGYCFADAALTGYRQWEKLEKAKHIRPAPLTHTNMSTSNEIRIALTSADTLLWQTLASVMIPGFTINAIVKASRLVTSTAMLRSVPAVAAAWIPTVVGLASIPVIIHPIDALVDFSLDNTTRKWFDLPTSIPLTSPTSNDLNSDKQA